MKYLSSCIALLLISFSAMTTAADLKVAVIDQVGALLKSEEAQKMLDAYKMDIETDRGKIIALEKEMTSMSERLEKDSLVLNQSEITRIKTEIQDKQLDRNVLIKKLKNKNQAAQQQIMSQLGPKMEKVLEKIQEKEKYDIILSRQSLIWADPKFDITEKVTKELNKMK